MQFIHLFSYLSIYQNCAIIACKEFIMYLLNTLYIYLHKYSVPQYYIIFMLVFIFYYYCISIIFQISNLKCKF